MMEPLDLNAIHNEADYRAALARIDALMGAEPNTPQGDELNALVDLVERYEEEIDEPDEWCRDFEGHKASHAFCDEHQAMWCRLCDRMCPDCVDDPHCPDCHCSLFCDEHDWDCSYY